ncbi:hypothetical protein T4C_13703 [Trichinella pseudospiralis]|uniref:Uncharacterized protein n=1 Tax=Trichinella pseudospiralis TaxID=6337 RepID=A0A0V1JGU1_TRIPS|nr:hypothetical protein T4C_13703 [Trichinella pseudospiralis]
MSKYSNLNNRRVQIKTKVEVPKNVNKNINLKNFLCHLGCCIILSKMDQCTAYLMFVFGSHGAG